MVKVMTILVELKELRMDLDYFGWALRPFGAGNEMPEQVLLIVSSCSSW